MDLLAPFMDGMFEAAKGKTKIVDGYESSYAYKQPSDFATAYKTIEETLLPMVAVPRQYQKHSSIGFGIWMDEDWRKYGWDTNSFSKNYFTPEAFENSVRTALKTSDEHVWIYTGNHHVGGQTRANQTNFRRRTTQHCGAVPANRNH